MRFFITLLALLTTVCLSSNVDAFNGTYAAVGDGGQMKLELSMPCVSKKGTAKGAMLAGGAEAKIHGKKSGNVIRGKMNMMGETVRFIAKRKGADQCRAHHRGRNRAVR